MTYAKLDDNFPRHPKIVGLPVAAKWLYVEAICYAAHYKTDGLIPRHALKEIGGTGRLASALADRQLWETDDRGWVIHDYLKHQTSKAEIEGRRNANVTRVKRHRNALLTQPEDRRQKTDNRIQNTDPSAAAMRARAVRAVEELTGTLTKPVGEAISAELEEGTDPEWILAACAEAALSNGRSWRYVDSILKRWHREGFQAPRKEFARGANQHPGARRGDHGARPEEPGVDW